jgi:DnaJ-class molecular chaperone
MSKRFVKNPFATLGVARASKDEEIRSAYLRAMREAHPDRGGSDEAAAILNTAYAAIRTQSARDEWSMTRELFGGTLCHTCEGAGGRFIRRKGGRALVFCDSCEGSGYV